MASSISLNILVGLEELGAALERYIQFTIGPARIRRLQMGEATELSKEVLSVDLWIAEAWNPTQPDNPEGFRTAMKLVGVCRVLLLFTSFLPDAFPEEGTFWTTCCSEKPLSAKVSEILEGRVPKREDYQALLKLWPALGNDPARHGHHHN